MTTDGSRGNSPQFLHSVLISWAPPEQDNSHLELIQSDPLWNVLTVPPVTGPPGSGLASGLVWIWGVWAERWEKLIDAILEVVAASSAAGGNR